MYPTSVAILAQAGVGSCFAWACAMASFVVTIEAIWGSSKLNNSQKKATVHCLAAQAFGGHGVAKRRGSIEVAGCVAKSGESLVPLACTEQPCIDAQKAALVRNLAYEVIATIAASDGKQYNGVWQASAQLDFTNDTKLKSILRDVNSATAVLHHINPTWCHDIATRVRAACTPAERCTDEGDTAAWPDVSSITGNSTPSGGQPCSSRPGPAAERTHLPPRVAIAEAAQAQEECPRKRRRCLDH